MKPLKYVLAILMTLFVSVGYADIITYVGDSNQGTNAEARNAWKAQVDSLGITRKRETFESKKWDPMRSDGCYSSSCLSPAVTTFSKSGFTWSKPGGAIRVISGGVIQGKYAMRAISGDLFGDTPGYTISVNNLRQLSYGFCIDLDTNVGHVGVEVYLDGRWVNWPNGSNSLDGAGGRYVYPTKTLCAIDTQGFRTMTLTAFVEPPEDPTDNGHAQIWSNDNVFITRTSTVPDFSSLLTVNNLDKDIADCAGDGGTWDYTINDCGYGTTTPPVTGGGEWDKDIADCAGDGGIWDDTTKECI